MQVRCVVVLMFAHAVLASVFPVPTHLNNVDVATTGFGTKSAPTNKSLKVGRRAGGRTKNRRSTSSSSGDKILGKDKSTGDSLGMASSGESSAEEKQRKPLEGGGWRKWHRKCTPCPADMVKKWRDPTIKWICGGYQRARRSFKSECMMYYRNCQDGTMFVKLADNRCNDKAAGYQGGRHFFYDYAVKIPEDTSGQSTKSEESSDVSSDSFYRKSSSGEG